MSHLERKIYNYLEEEEEEKFIRRTFQSRVECILITILDFKQLNICSLTKEVK